MKERTVLASFYSEKEAQKAADIIRTMGVDTTQVDELHAFPGVPPERHAFAITGQFEGLESLTLNTTTDSKDAGILLSVHPSASGMTDGRDEVTGRNFLLTVVCPEYLVEQVVDCIKTNNGYT